MGNHFVLGETIEAALSRAQPHSSRHRRYSFDMLGEGARTADDAARYFNSYASAIEAIGRTAGDRPLPDRPGISVKLSALHPRFEAVSRARVMRELVPRLIDLARQAKSHDLNFTVDAEEADRLELSLDVIAAALGDSSLAGWDGFGLAIQAYQKRASDVIDYVDASRTQPRPQNDGAAGQGRLLGHRDQARAGTRARRLSGVHPQGDDGSELRRLRATIAGAAAADFSAVRHPQCADGRDHPRTGNGPGGFEFQRLHGMGEALYAKLGEDRPDIAHRTYAPVGSHRDLLAYLVRRLLENGANSSFVALAADEAVPVSQLLRRPADIIGMPTMPRIPTSRCRAICMEPDGKIPAGSNSANARRWSNSFLEPIARRDRSPRGGSIADATPRARPNRGDTRPRATASRHWSRTPAETRAAALEKAADLLEQRAAHFIALLQREGGKTLDDAISEVREAVDFCRYYAAQGRELFGEGKAMPGPTGESNVLRLRGRGVFVAISPWNFPLAIFLGQVTAALMAGNAVVAKPAEQTPLIAAEAVRLLHEAGVPASALHLVAGDGRIGGVLVAHPDIAGVVFTGSTEVARTINRALAAKDGPIVPLIAETGGINAMIVDATALPEQVADDVVTSAFRSAGQRCSALRLLFLQDDVADRMIEMIAGAARELVIGDPAIPPPISAR